ncbi:MAG: hypothetical protein AAF267_21405 [Deinococcota bacterium]
MHLSSNFISSNLPVLRRIYAIWWPLALSWGFMGLEQPLVSAVISRLANPTIQLAAMGGVVFPLALIIESPIVMLLAAATALTDHKQAYTRMYTFMMWTCGLITVFHALLAFTPLFDLVVVQWMRPPTEIIEPARMGLRLMLPWTWSIGYRRFHQGVLIRYGSSSAISLGTALRLLGNGVGMATGVMLRQPGIVVAALGISCGVLTEAVFIGLRARPIIKHYIKDATDSVEHLSWQHFQRFYVPLALTSFVLLFSQPLGAFALNRMPNPLTSNAVWPVLVSFIFLFRSMGFAYNEVVVTSLKENVASFRDLRRFALILSSVLTSLLIILAFTPLAASYFERIVSLPDELATIAEAAFVYCILWPAVSCLRNLYQGLIVAKGNTRYVTEAVVVSLVVSALLLFSGVVLASIPGIYVAILAFLMGNAAQVGWLAWRSRTVLERLDQEGDTFKLQPATSTT